MDGFGKQFRLAYFRKRFLGPTFGVGPVLAAALPCAISSTCAENPGRFDPARLDQFQYFSGLGKNALAFEPFHSPVGRVRALEQLSRQPAQGLDHGGFTLSLRQAPRKASRRRTASNHSPDPQCPQCCGTPFKEGGLCRIVKLCDPPYFARVCERFDAMA